ncbi:MAG: hypothetical protein J6T24_03915 [Clostridia bacterium]|nr:hypothetical protein [Clostridia bacterium]
MQYVDFFGHKVSKLIVGDNPFNGWSYIPTFIPGKEMKEYYTEDKILEAIYKMEELGINTMLPLADPYIIRVLTHYRANGGKMNFIFQTWGPMMMTPETWPITMRNMQEVQPIGVYLSGTFTDVRRETGRDQEIKDMLGRMRAMGIPLGLCTHRPENIAEFENGEGWDFDFYMACMYNARRNREGQESGFLTGKSKGDIEFHPSDRGEMLEAIKDVKKPILAFKIFAGGQMLAEKNEAERRELIRDAYDTIFTTLKPNDLGVMGVFQKHHDQLTENVSVFNEWAAKA